MNTTTNQTITLTDPDGRDVEVEIEILWSNLQRNPMDKVDAQYKGEDDGREPMKVKLV